VHWGAALWRPAVAGVVMVVLTRPFIGMPNTTRVAAAGTIVLWTIIGLAGYAAIGGALGLHRIARR
jgi:hypothetical protein